MPTSANGFVLSCSAATVRRLWRARPYFSSSPFRFEPLRRLFATREIVAACSSEWRLPVSRSSYTTSVGCVLPAPYSQCLKIRFRLKHSERGFPDIVRLLRFAMQWQSMQSAQWAAMMQAAVTAIVVAISARHILHQL